ncbi:MAG TPA: hypothetical protein VN841_13510 [Bryobacteraceae bacterium]|nr:hypothetical protein [Bryobacteraceae bacterium]
MDAVAAVFRWLHFSGVIILVGGIFYARVVAHDLIPAFKPWGYGAIGAILVSGLVNILSKPALPPHYYAWFGVKILLALHVFGVVVRYRGKQRLLTGALITAALIVGISEVLRYISLP